MRFIRWFVCKWCGKKFDQSGAQLVHEQKCFYKK